MIPIHIVWENMFYKACSCICKQGEQLLKLLVYACTKSRNKTFKISRQIEILKFIYFNKKKINDTLQNQELKL